MKKILSCLLILCCLSVKSPAQGIGTWQSHLSYHNTTAVAETNEYVFALANQSLYSYNKDDNSLQFYSSLNGLNDTYISQIGYSAETNKLVIAYATNGNIDLLQPGKSGTKNLPFLKDDIMIQDKTVNSIYFYKEYAYLSTAFGIVVINLRKEEITDTYKLQTGVYATCINGNTIYAATKDKGVLQAPLSANLLDYHNWKSYPLAIAANETVQQCCFFSDKFTFYLKSNTNNGVYYRQSDGSIQTIKKDASLKGLTLQNGKLIAYGSSYAMIMSSFTDAFTLNNSPVNGISSLKDPNTFWIASGDAGLKGVKRNGNSVDLIVSGLEMDSPIRNLDAFMTFHNQKLLVAGGDRWENRGEKPGTLMVYENGQWYNFDQATVAKAAGVRFMDITSVAVDPLDENHYYASAWGEGVFEFKDNKLVKVYNHTNSTLQSVFPENPGIAYNYIRVEGLCFDKDNNLWMTNSAVSNGLKVLRADGTWLSFKGGLSSVDLADKILITRNNHKWINVIRKPSKMVVFDDKGTLDDTDDDTAREITTFYQSSSSGTSGVDVSTYYCMAEDKKSGAIWIGTNIGPLICASPRNAIEKPDASVIVSRPVREGNDGQYDYFLNGQPVTAIAIDGGNRKWLGTESTGLFVVSEDGAETVEHFTTDNSPLPSNKINSLAINPVTGEVFIGTNKGIISYMSGTSEGSETYSDVYAYPNPVRPEHNDQVTITGLMTDSNVKITDINGNLIYQAKSLGGQLTWNCRKKNGERVATGIYLVLAAQPDKGESVVTKIMVVK